MHHFAMDHIVIFAAARDHSDAFYTRLLGRLGFNKHRDGVFARDGLFFDIRPAKSTEGHMTGGPGVDHIGFRASTRAEVDSISRAMSEAGHPGQVIEFDNGDYALFLPDPDGLRIEITCYADPKNDPVD